MMLKQTYNRCCCCLFDFSSPEDQKSAAAQLVNVIDLINQVRYTRIKMIRNYVWDNDLAIPHS